VDPRSELQWLHDQLLLAEQERDKVWILSHIPTGASDCAPGWAKQYRRIINRFRNTVVNQFFGHTHNDEFFIFYDEEETPYASAIVTPSLNTWGFLNPAYRIYTVDGDYLDSTRVSLIGHSNFFMTFSNP